MTRRLRNLKSAVAAFLLTAGAGLAQGGADRLDDLFAALQRAEGTDAQQIAAKIASEWSKSGSPAMDLLLERGRDALDAGETQEAIGHFTALIDHAPDFAEGYNSRATAFFQAREFGPALSDLRRTLALNPRHFGALTGLAVILTDIGAEEAALEAWREVQRLFPASPQAGVTILQLERSLNGRSL
ncbi:tetratricopeptide repeat protein [Palleronia sp.]|uniref:tetratricopeptide repeat protein n=1 Tax=Palleronia sp. TaxID=1940284 RepID=UPI0035C868FA